MNKYTELIDNYLSGNLGEDEKRSFEAQLRSDKALKEEFELQSQVLHGIMDAGIRSEINQGFSRASFRSRGIKIIAGLGIAILIATSVWVIKNRSVHHDQVNIRHELNEENYKQWSDADKHLMPEIFIIDSGSDTVIETKNGIVFAIPATAFSDAEGKAVVGEVELEIKEAMNPMDIMKAGLSTSSDGTMLETGGMFYINARQNGLNLSINKGSGIYASIPDLNPGKNMMLFDGKRMPNGKIDWVDPQPFESRLNPVDIMTLNFYPPHFLDTLHAFGFDTGNKKLTDSIYYSLACDPEEDYTLSDWDTDPHAVSDSSANDRKKVKNTKPGGAQLFKRNCSMCHTTDSRKLTGPGLAGMMGRVPGGSWLASYILNNQKLIRSGDPYANKIYLENGKQGMPVYEGILTERDVKSIINYINYPGQIDRSGSAPCEIDPARIRAIWDRKFNNTLLATKEFEERLRVIFQYCNHHLLELYVNNAGKKMYVIDSLAAVMMHEQEPGMEGPFTRFYFRKDGRVPVDEAYIKKLQAYLAIKTKVYKDAALKSLRDIYATEKTMAAGAFDEWLKHEARDNTRIKKAFDEELQLNLQEMYRQLGTPQPSARTFNVRYLGVSIVDFGWKNVDAYVSESLKARQSLGYSENNSGRSAVIKYGLFSMMVTEFEKFDRVYAYLIADEVSSFLRVPNKGNIFKENLNGMFKYSVLVLGFSGDEIYFSEIPEAGPGNRLVSLTRMSAADLERYKGLNKAVMDDFNYFVSEQKETLRIRKIEEREAIKSRLWPIVYPCAILPQAAANK